MKHLGPVSWRPCIGDRLVFCGGRVEIRVRRHGHGRNLELVIDYDDPGDVEITPAKRRAGDIDAEESLAEAWESVVEEL